MKTEISRREFLRLMALASLNFAFPQNVSPPGNPRQGQDHQNVLIVVFDAWSAANVSLYGYARQTTPHLDKLANRAVVYHNHYAGGHFTTPGTASLLTGTHSWTNRAFNFYPVFDEDFLAKNIFRAFAPYYRFAYSHNPLADYLLSLYLDDLDNFESWEKLYFEHSPMLKSFKQDEDIASVSWDRIVQSEDDGYSYSLLLARIYERRKARRLAAYEEVFPRGVPNSEGESFYTLEQGIDWLTNLAQSVSQPFLGYYHFLPPHDPYNTRTDFVNQFQKDGYIPLDKPPHFFQNTSPEYLKVQRRWYDEFILYVDAEFARLYQQLEHSGLLENTWIVLTSDHGELSERSIWGHSVPLFYHPLVNVPLVIFPPGQKERIDVYERTSAVDVLSTLLHVTDQDIPSWVEGVVLTPFGDPMPKEARDISAVQVDEVVNGNIKAASAMVVRNKFKATWLFGYDEIESGNEIIELYDLEADPEELFDLSLENKEIADELVGRLRSKMEVLEQTYQ